MQEIELYGKTVPYEGSLGMYDVVEATDGVKVGYIPFNLDKLGQKAEELQVDEFLRLMEGGLTIIDRLGKGESPLKDVPLTQLDSMQEDQVRAIANTESFFRDVIATLRVQ